MSVEAERAVLGAVFLDNSAWEQVSAVVRSEDFSKYAHSKVYNAMAQLANAGEPIDLVTVHGACGVPPDQVAALTDTVPSAANVAHYAAIVHDAGVKRNTIRVLRETLERAQDMEGASEIIEHVESRVLELHNDVGGQYRHIREYTKGAMDQVEENYRAAQEGRTVGVPTGLTELDELTGGLRKQDLIVVGARASIGKTALGLSISRNVAKDTPCGFFSLEMSGEQLAMRMISMHGRVRLTKLRNGGLRPADFKDLTDAAGRVYDSKLWVYDVPNARLSDMKAKARRLVAREGVKIIVVDYVGLIRTDEKFQKRNEQIGYITRELKQLARELDIPIVMLAQLSRNAEGKRPTLADLAESGNIEQDADVIMLLHRDRLSEETKTECAVLKYRNGATGIVDLAFLKAYTLFQDYSEEAEERWRA